MTKGWKEQQAADVTWFAAINVLQCTHLREVRCVGLRIPCGSLLLEDVDLVLLVAPSDAAGAAPNTATGGVIQ